MGDESEGKKFSQSIWKAAESRCPRRERQEVLPISNLSSPYVETNRRVAAQPQPRSRPPSRQGMQTRARSGCCTHFGVRLRIGQDVCHATVHKTGPVCRQERTIWSRKSPLFGRVQLHPRTPSQTFRGTQKSSHLGSGGIAQEGHQMAKGGRIATTDSGCVITTTTFLQHPTLPIF